MCSGLKGRKEGQDRQEETDCGYLAVVKTCHSYLVFKETEALGWPGQASWP